MILTSYLQTSRQARWTQSHATRIIKLRDGKIQADSRPFVIDEEEMETPVHKNMGKASMSFLNASLPAAYGTVLIILSVFLTLLGGLLPSGKAAKSDPVAALRSE